MQLSQRLVIYGLFLISMFFIPLRTTVADEPDAAQQRVLQEFLNARKERGVETDEQLNNNYTELWGNKENYLYKTGYIFINRALGHFPPSARKLDIFGDYRLTPELQQFCQNKNLIYLNEPYHPDKNTLPLRYVLSQNSFLRDMLYWEWEANEIQFRKLETGTGMILSIIPSNADIKSGISNKELMELLLKVTKIPSGHIADMVRKSPSVLKEGTVFSNVTNLHELTEAKIFTQELQNKFPSPHKIGEWSSLLVGFISKDAICLIIIHETPIPQNIEHDPTVILGSFYWLSGRILQKDGTPVLPRGVKKVPEWWKPVLEDNVRHERVRQKTAEEKRIEEAKWRVWHDKDGKPLLNGRKMKFEYWERNNPIDFRFKAGTVTMGFRNVPEAISGNFPLNEFSTEDKKLIMAIPPKQKQQLKSTETNTIYTSPDNPDKEKTKKTEPEKDDIE
ncbi:MAG: hypothetical protein LBE18_09885 [Planctomycetaceae bacterium]|jgi:hypothetical protein|nr:hypothetical protein [Planctomycetaceae bacterium]